MKPRRSTKVTHVAASDHAGSGWYTVRLDATGLPASIKKANLAPTADAMTADVDTIVEHVKHAILEESNLLGFVHEDGAETQGERQPKRQRRR